MSARSIIGVMTLALTIASGAQAETTVRVGQPQAGTFQFVPLQVGSETGIFKKHGIKVEVSSFGGGPRVQQAIAADSIDIGLGSGPELALAAKGAPEIGVAAMADAPYAVLLAVLNDSPIKTAADLKGRTISVSSKGSLTYWLAQELSRLQGWGPDGFKIAPLGSTGAQSAALKTHQIDGMIVEANAGYRLEEEGTGHVLVQFGDIIKTFHIYVIYARKAFAAQNPDAVRAFLAGWFETVDWMRAHRTETIDILRSTAEASPVVATRDYDELIGMFNRTGRFDPKALAVLSRSFVEMGMLPQEPDIKTLITEEYLPAVK
ncbi:MAG TPA: ABC transporter substrate-binding protein [Xanthobacteraceae bacterium]|jgi:ABC-type nitrate/sulfonate/bicarbonate transport system substrate-binding protein